MNAVQIIKMAADGNADAERFCKAWVGFCHVLDDCYDRDHPVSDSCLASVFVQIILEVSGNPFFLLHKPMLLSLMVQGANAWLDSNRPGITQAERDVLKGFYHEVVFHVAFLVGGWSHLRR